MSYHDLSKITIRKNPNGDTRTAPKNITFEQFHEANVSHMKDVKTVMLALAMKLAMQGQDHDWTKLSYEKEFYDNFLDTINNGTDFVSNTWYQKHIKEEKHHPFSKCHDDITLLDIIETIVDRVCAGKARSGEIRPLEFDEKILEKAVKNTVALVDDMTAVVEED